MYKKIFEGKEKGNYTTEKFGNLMESLEAELIFLDDVWINDSRLYHLKGVTILYEARSDAMSKGMNVTVTLLGETVKIKGIEKIIKESK